MYKLTPESTINEVGNLDSLGFFYLESELDRLTQFEFNYIKITDSLGV